MFIRSALAAGALSALELTDRLERILAGAAGASEVQALGRAVAAEPVTTELLLAAAGPLRSRAVPLTPPPNRAIIDVSDATTVAHGLVAAAPAVNLLVAAADGTVAHQAPLYRNAPLYRAMGLSSGLSPEKTRVALEWTGFAVLSPGGFHPAAAALGPLFAEAPRFFALLAPLLHPVPAPCQVVAVDDPGACAQLLDALVECGATAALVYTSAGAPFLSPDADSMGILWRDGVRSAFTLPAAPESAGDLTSAGPARDAARLVAVLSGVREPLAAGVAATAGAALWVAGLLPSLGEGRAWAADRLAQGVDLAELGAALSNELATSRSRTGRASAATGPHSPRPPRAAARPARHRRG